MANWFNRSLRIPNIRTSVHDLSNDYKSSINFGGAYPSYAEDCVPKTNFINLSSEIFLRFAPMKFPVMHRCKVRQNTFGVPYRLIMGDENYNKFTNNELDIPDLILTFLGKSFDFKNTIFDYLGRDVRGLNAQLQAVPEGDAYEVNIGNPLDYLSYLLIWRTWYADEVLDVEFVNRIDGLLESYRKAMANGDSALRLQFYGPSLALLGGDGVLPVSYTKDYFSAAQIEPQRGGDVFLMNPLNVVGVNSGDSFIMQTRAGNPAVLLSGSTEPNPTSSEFLRSSETIRDLWQKEQLQRYRDISALFGTRTNEYLAGHFGVISSDARLQMPQFIGGGEQIVQIQEVVQTSSDTENSPLGSLAGKAQSFGRTRNIRYFCEEHMFVMSLLSVVPDNGYMTGNPRYVYKKNILDFASPEFNNIGYQPVYKGEIFASADPAVDKQEFGYQPRYSEYRQHRSIATGDFRDSTLMAWHLNRSFDSLPPLNSEFIHVNKADSARIFNNSDPTAQHIYVDVFHKVNVASVVSYMPSSLHL